MEQSQSAQGGSPPPASSSPAPLPPNGITTTISSNTPHKRASSSGSSFLSRLPFMRSSPDSRASKQNDDQDNSRRLTSSSSLSSLRGAPPVSLQQQAPQTQAPQKTRRRRGSLRKVALLGRTRVKRASSIDSAAPPPAIAVTDPSPPADMTIVPLAGAATTRPAPGDIVQRKGQAPGGLGISNNEQQAHFDGAADNISEEISQERRAIPVPSHAPPPPPVPAVPPPPPPAQDTPDITGSPTTTHSTTDDEDALHMRLTPESQPSRPDLSTTNSSPYFPRPDDTTTLRKRSIHRPRSPLALTNLPTAAIPPTIPEEETWDYSETEFWGWIILFVTWIVFVTGMGSVFGVWSWAWDVGTTPYAPPELEDDPTLPIVGYYPALMILTCVMAWVWVFTAWVGMKYFRHAKIGEYA